ncbi:hypothetical protein FQZ97_701530 [compost metagenome]
MPLRGGAFPEHAPALGAQQRQLPQFVRAGRQHAGHGVHLQAHVLAQAVPVGPEEPLEVIGGHLRLDRHQAGRGQGLRAPQRLAREHHQLGGLRHQRQRDRCLVARHDLRVDRGRQRRHGGGVGRVRQHLREQHGDRPAVAEALARGDLQAIGGQAVVARQRRLDVVTAAARGHALVKLARCALQQRLQHAHQFLALRVADSVQIDADAVGRVGEELGHAPFEFRLVRRARHVENEAAHQRGNAGPPREVARELAKTVGGPRSAHPPRQHLPDAKENDAENQDADHQQHHGGCIEGETQKAHAAAFRRSARQLQATGQSSARQSRG